MRESGRKALFRGRNNDAVSNLSSQSDLGQIINTLEQLLTDLQSLPIPVLFPDVELTVSFNLVALQSYK